ncbi:MAG: glycosyltransferase [Acidimicrobiia bacterium]
MPRVSVLMAAYNAEQHIGEAIESVLRQTFTDWELVIVDDGSTDATAALVRTCDDPRVRLHRLAKNSGLVAALNTGLSLCRAPLVARFDADDRCLPGRLAAQVARMEAEPALGLLGASAIEIDRSGVATGTRTSPGGPEVVDRLRWRNAVVHPAAMFRRSVAESVGGYQAKAGRYEDYDLWLRIGAVAGIDNVIEPLLEYRVHAGQVTARRTFAWQAALTIGRSRLAFARARRESVVAAMARHAIWVGWQIRREVRIGKLVRLRPVAARRSVASGGAIAGARTIGRGV